MGFPGRRDIARRVNGYAPRAVGLLRWRRERGSDVSMRCVEQLVREGDVALDIGANRGIYSARFLHQVGRTGRVHAFEAHPAHLEWLRALQRRSPNLDLHHVALTDHDGTAQLNVPVVDGKEFLGMGTLEDPTRKMEADVHHVTVPARRLDSLLAQAERIDFIKCDVEGHEDMILDGASVLLERHKPSILLELEQRHRGTDPRKTIDRLHQLGLEGWAIFPDGLRPVGVFDLEADQLRYLAGTGAREVMPPGYVHNFLFVAPGTAPQSLLA